MGLKMVYTFTVPISFRPNIGDIWCTHNGGCATMLYAMRYQGRGQAKATSWEELRQLDDVQLVLCDKLPCLQGDPQKKIKMKK